MENTLLKDSDKAITLSADIATVQQVDHTWGLCGYECVTISLGLPSVEAFLKKLFGLIDHKLMSTSSRELLGELKDLFVKNKWKPPPLDSRHYLNMTLCKH